MSETASVAYSTNVSASDVKLTAAAASKMAELLASADDEIEAIRVFVAGGGCGGMTYAMTYADEVSEYDSTLEQDDCKVVVDAVALNFLRGCEIDFSGDSFIFNNVFQAVGGSGACGGCGGGAF